MSSSRFYRFAKAGVLFGVFSTVYTLLSLDITVSDLYQLAIGGLMLHVPFGLVFAFLVLILSTILPHVKLYFISASLSILFNVGGIVLLGRKPDSAAAWTRILVELLWYLMSALIFAKVAEGRKKSQTAT